MHRLLTYTRLCGCQGRGYDENRESKAEAAHPQKVTKSAKLVLNRELRRVVEHGDQKMRDADELE